MTNAEAVSLLKQALAEIEWTQPMQYAAAIDKAIEALEERMTLKDTPTIPITDNLETILICAVRYACGRNTYMPGLVQDYIIGTFGGKLKKSTLEIMQRDIEEQIDMMRRFEPDPIIPSLSEHDLMFGLRDWVGKELAAKEAKV